MNVATATIKLSQSRLCALYNALLAEKENFGASFRIFDMQGETVTLSVRVIVGGFWFESPNV